MRLDQRSAIALAFRHPSKPGASGGRDLARIEIGRFANLAFMAIVLALAALWFVFPPAQLSSSPAPRPALAQDLPALDVPR